MRKSLGTRLGSETKKVHLVVDMAVVPQAAKFTYILFTQEISTRDTSGQHGFSDTIFNSNFLRNRVGHSKVVCAGWWLKALCFKRILL